MCNETNEQNLKAFEEELASLQPNPGRLDDSWSDWLGQKFEATRREEYVVVRPSTSKSSRFFSSGKLLFNLSETGPFACLVSILIIGSLGLAAWGWWNFDFRYLGVQKAIGASNHPQKQENLLNTITRNTKPNRVARITEIMNCRWTPETPALNCLDFLVTGQWLRLDSGLLEITYDSGAKVLLQGPAVYEVRPNGGSLASGKLVAQWAKKATAQHEAGKPSEEVSTASGHTPPFTLAIRTPTVGVVDHGTTEFGLEVTHESTSLQVFQGSAALCSMADTLQQQPYHVAEQGQSLRFTCSQEDQAPAMESVAVKPDTFIRHLPGRPTP